MADQQPTFIKKFVPRTTITRLFIGFFPLEKFEKKIHGAGLTGIVSPEQYAAATLAGLVMAILGFFSYLQIWGSEGMVNKVALATMFLIPALPYNQLSNRAKVRTRRLSRGLPETISLMLVALLAGRSPDEALQIVGDNRPDEPIAIDLQLILRYKASGDSLKEAMEKVASRTESDQWKGVLSAMAATADRSGQLAERLEKQAEHLREQRQLAAEEWANKIEIKLIFPIMLCIFPSLLIVLIAPPGLQIMRELGNIGN